MHRADIPSVTDGCVNAENADGTLRPGWIADPATNHPAVKIRNCDRRQGNGPCKESGSPSPAARRLPGECVAFVVTKTFAVRTLRRPAFLRQDQIGCKGPYDSRPVPIAMDATTAEEVVRDNSHLRGSPIVLRTGEVIVRQTYNH